MRRLRRKAGARSSLDLFKYEGEEMEQRVFDSSHFIGAKIIEKYMLKRNEKQVMDVLHSSRSKGEKQLTGNI